jgi:exonuclease III
VYIGPPSGDLEYFFHHLENILHSLHNPTIQFILCGDLNINFNESSHKKHQLDNLLNMYMRNSLVSHQNHCYYIHHDW